MHMRNRADVRARVGKSIGSIDRCSALRWAALAMSCAFAAGCATTPEPQATGAHAQRLEEVSAIAGEQVDSFRYMDQATFEPIGLSDLLVYTSPREAWLLHLDGECRDLDFEPFLKLTSHMHRVSTLSDSVIVRNNPIPCQIREIRPINAAALKNNKSAQPQGRMEIQTTIGAHSGN
jgi:hypothetical protein